MAEKLSLCDLEQLENPEFLDAKEKAQQFLYANGQGFGVALDSAINIIGKIFVFAGLIAVLSTLNIFVVLAFIAIVLISGFFESKVRADYVKWDMEKAPIERKTGYYMGLNEDFSYGKEIRLYNFRDKLISKISTHLGISNDFKLQIKNEETIVKEMQLVIFDLNQSTELSFAECSAPLQNALLELVPRFAGGVTKALNKGNYNYEIFIQNGSTILDYYATVSMEIG